MKKIMNAKTSFLVGIVSGLEISPSPLLLLDRDEKCLEVSLAKSFAAFALKNFVENCWPVFDRFGKYLEQVTFVVTVDQNAEAFEFFNVLVDAADAIGYLIVVGVRYAKKFYPVRLQLGNR